MNSSSLVERLRAPYNFDAQKTLLCINGVQSSCRQFSYYASICLFKQDDFMTRHHGTLPQLLPVPDRFAESQHILAAWQAGQSRLHLKQKKRAAGLVIWEKLILKSQSPMTK